MKLNQLKPGLQYKLVSQTGPVHAPIFTMSVEIDGSTFEASGPSKKTAKLHVAVKVGATAVLGRGELGGPELFPPGSTPKKELREAAQHPPLHLPPAGASGHGFAHGGGRQRLGERRRVGRGNRAETRGGGSPSRGGDGLDTHRSVASRRSDPRGERRGVPEGGRKGRVAAGCRCLG